MIAKHILRFINLLVKFKIVKNVYKIRYVGKIPSFNDIYETKHWSVRYNLSQKYHKIFAILFKAAKLPKIQEFSLYMTFNSRHDVDNLIAIEKFFTDALTQGKYIENDNQKSFKSIHIVLDRDLPTNTVDFTIIAHNVSD